METRDIRQLLMQVLHRFLLAVTNTELQVVQIVKPAWWIISSDNSGSFDKKWPWRCRLRASLEPSEDEQECKGHSCLLTCDACELSGEREERRPWFALCGLDLFRPRAIKKLYIRKYVERHLRFYNLYMMLKKK